MPQESSGADLQPRRNDTGGITASADRLVSAAGAGSLVSEGGTTPFILAQTIRLAQMLAKVAINHPEGATEARSED